MLPPANAATTREAIKLLRLVALILQIFPARNTTSAAIIVGRFPKHIDVGVQNKFPTPNAKTGYEIVLANWAVLARNSMASSLKPVAIPAVYMFAMNTMIQTLARVRCRM
jgi:hypothetical protein